MHEGSPLNGSSAKLSEETDRFVLQLCLRDSSNKNVFFHQRNMGHAEMKNTIMVVAHVKEEMKVGVLSEVILAGGALVMSVVDVSVSLHTSRRMMETW